MRKRLTGFWMASVILAGSALIPFKPAFAEVIIDGDLLNETPEKTDGEAMEEVDLFELVENLDKEELLKDLNAILVLLRSDEFDELMHYREFRDLIKVALKQAESFAEEERELSEKILETLGWDEKQIRLFYLILDKVPASEESFNELMESPDVQKIVKVSEETLKDPEVQASIREIIRLLADQTAKQTTQEQTTQEQTMTEQTAPE